MEFEIRELRPGKPILYVSDELLEGYLLLERDEQRFTAYAMEQHAAFVQIWYRFLKLLKDGVLSLGEEVEHPAGTVSNQLALQFIAASGGTVKMILDAGLSGYYAQAYALVRHLFETWLRLEYIRLRPDEAPRWYVGEDGSEPRPPNEGKIHRYVRKHAEGGRKETAVRIIDEKLPELNLMAHPSPVTLQQTIGVSEDRFEVGANYDPDLCLGVLHEGASGLRFILGSLNDFAPQPDAWRRELDTAMEQHRNVLDNELRRKDCR